ncbi:cytochrome P450 [Coprinopsis marcescibilis]|uniref:Cytochrome P450 n=1 Tax=Coprinopsis marcescibilis TaxID=230819 RepID=A0A5C3KTL1_COPMA|nr:cytochrome P450 [Coprinopsis marcescibilis]
MATAWYTITAGLGCSLLLALLFFGCSGKRERKFQKEGFPLPPGPAKLPVFGNALDLPPKKPWITYARWAKEYKSDIIHLRILNTSVAVLNSAQVANDLLGKRNILTFSTRPRLTYSGDRMGWSWLMTSLSYGRHWKDQRLLFHQHLHPTDDSLHKVRTSEYVHRLMYQLATDPTDFMGLIKHCFGGIMCSLAYGLRTHPTNDPYIQFTDKIATVMGDIMIPASSLVDSIPLLKYLPESFPGASFKRKAREWRELTVGFREVPFDAAREAIVSADGTAIPSFTSMCLEGFDNTGSKSDSGNSDDEAYNTGLVRDTTGLFFIAGTASTSAVVYTFILVMLCFPEVQRKVQAELDRVVGRERLPEFSDEPYTPYLSAVIKEVMRWRPVSPMGMAHYLQQDDIYEGYLIPANTIMIPNAWAMLQDERDYPDPFTFNPDRFLTPNGELRSDVRDPETLLFGFGRRSCPGMHISVSAVWLTAANLLASFTISEAVGEDGKEVEPSMAFTSGVTCQPEPFVCDIRPRSTCAVDMIRSAVESLREGGG